MIPAAERFFAKVLEDENGCWLWQAGKNRGGYGRFGSGGRAGGTVQAHRWAYEHLIADIPKGLHIDHLCRVKSCVNPYHLKPVTQAENNKRLGAAQTRCVSGHDFTPENTLVRPNGTRRCRECHRIDERRRNANRPLTPTAPVVGPNPTQESRAAA